jgi:hypothetical protein
MNKNIKYLFFSILVLAFLFFGFRHLQSCKTEWSNLLASQDTKIETLQLQIDSIIKRQALSKMYVNGLTYYLGSYFAFCDSAKILNYSDKEFIAKYGNPESEEIFAASHARRDNIRLIEKYYPYPSEESIKELNWNVNDSIYLLVWYSHKVTTWLPFEFTFRNVRAEY